MKAGNRVRLKSMNGKLVSDIEAEAREDYCKLIGEIGTIVHDPQEKSLYDPCSKDKRVLVRFDCNLSNLGLENHNNVSNALWHLVTDLEFLIETSSH